MWTTTRQINASPQAVWDTLIDTHAWPDWGPSVQAVDCTHRWIEVGSRGRVKALGLWVPFEIDDLAVDPRAGVWRWSWRVAGVRATEHAVRARHGGAALVFGVPWYAPPYLAICAAAARRIAALHESAA